MKTCSRCGQEKLSSGFARDKKAADGLRRDCKDCTSTAAKHGDIELVDPAAVWATKPIGQTYWQQAGEYMLGDRYEMPVG